MLVEEKYSRQAALHRAAFFSNPQPLLLDNTA
jgi:hypothetical protein